MAEGTSRQTAAHREGGQHATRRESDVMHTYLKSPGAEKQKTG